MVIGRKPLVGAIVVLLPLLATAMPAVEEQRVKRLLTRIETTESAVFIRNGREYTAGDAAEFLRSKCGGRLAEFANAEQLVRECAAHSSASGEVYRIRLGSTAARPSAEVLGEWLRQGSAPKN